MDQKITRIFCTDISRDGLLQGVALELYKRILTAFPDLQLIASGGVSSAADVGSLQEIGCYGVIIGKAIYEGRVTLKELSKFEYGLA